LGLPPRGMQMGGFIPEPQHGMRVSWTVLCMQHLIREAFSIHSQLSLQSQSFIARTFPPRHGCPGVESAIPCSMMDYCHIQ
jgi:hypothetical protein